MRIEIDCHLRPKWIGIMSDSDWKGTYRKELDEDWLSHHGRLVSQRSDFDRLVLATMTSIVMCRNVRAVQFSLFLTVGLVPSQQALS